MAKVTSGNARQLVLSAVSVYSGIPRLSSRPSKQAYSVMSGGFVLADSIPIQQICAEQDAAAG